MLDTTPHSQNMQRAKGRAEVVFAARGLNRVDFWWWGEEMPLVVFGWINVPMLYQFGIWVAGFALVLYTVKYIWVDEQ